ncbi:MAG: AI-2E family transporter [Treponema sp.]|nr:AI-2E family transporter [Treponema sp.]
MSEEKPSRLMPSQWTVQNYVIAGILVLLFIAVLRLIAPFFTPILWAILLYILLSPLHRRLVANLDFNTFKGKILRNVWAGVFTLGTLIIILIPISLVAAMFIRQSIELVNQAHTFLTGGELYSILQRISGFFYDLSGGYLDITTDYIINQITSALAGELQRVVSFSGNIFRNIGSFLLGLMLISFSVYFFYLDGSYLFNLMSRAIPIKNEYISALKIKFLDITRNLFFGYVIIALLQSLIAYIIFTIFGINGSLVFAVLTFFLVFIPMIGAIIIWLPLGIMMIAGGNTAGGLLFMAISMVLISSIDNIIRPLFLKDRIKLHPLLIFFSILGGIIAFGFNGFILGPVLVIFFLTVLDIFLDEHFIGSGEGAIQ